MGYTLRTVDRPRSTRIAVHSSTLAGICGRTITLGSFASRMGGKPIRVQVAEFGYKPDELVVECGSYPDVDFIQGQELPLIVRVRA